jgi:hypothetical protein
VAPPEASATSGAPLMNTHSRIVLVLVHHGARVVGPGGNRYPIGSTRPVRPSASCRVGTARHAPHTRASPPTPQNRTGSPQPCCREFAPPSARRRTGSLPASRRARWGA